MGVPCVFIILLAQSNHISRWLNRQRQGFDNLLPGTVYQVWGSDLNMYVWVTEVNMTFGEAFGEFEEVCSRYDVR